MSPQQEPQKGSSRLQPRHKKRWWIAPPLVLLLIIAALLVGGSWTITPPPAPRRPAVVFVGDYGRHARLAMQLNEESMVEYAFGDWRYYALGERSVWRGAMALAIPTDAALGRRPLPFVTREPDFVRISGAQYAVKIEVEGDKLANLIAGLDQRYRRNLETEVAPEDAGLAFVRDERSYHLFRNSNYQVAQWLEELGCDVSGFPVLSNFQLEPLPVRPTLPPQPPENASRP